MRRRFALGWAVAWGLASVVVELTTRGGWRNSGTTVVANPTMSERTETVLLFAGCAVAGGLGAWLMTSSLRMSARARLLTMLLWSAIGIGLVLANLRLASPAQPDWWFAYTIGSGKSAGVLALFFTLPIAGAIGGLVQGLLVDRGIARPLFWAALWAAAFFVAARLSMLSIYLVGGMVTDLVEALGSAATGKLIGTFLGGAIAGYVAGHVASLSTELDWRTPPLAAGAPRHAV